MTTEHSWRFVPPLQLPLTLRLDNGRFGALRPTPLPGPPRHCTTTQIIPATDPRNPTDHDVYYANEIHEAVDLAATAGDCVFAAYSGRVVEVESDPAATRGNVTIDHHPRGHGYVTKYNHITDIAVGLGDFVTKGTPIAAVSAQPTEPHLHFEWWTVIDRPSSEDDGWPGDGDLLPIDPTRALYAWEQRTAGDEPFAAGPVVPESVGLTYLSTVPFFTVTFGGLPDVLHVPLYDPVGADERLAVRLLRDAHAAKVGVTVRSRASAFWGVDVVTNVEVSDAVSARSRGR